MCLARHKGHFSCVRKAGLCEMWVCFHPKNSEKKIASTFFFSTFLHNYSSLHDFEYTIRSVSSNGLVCPKDSHRLLYLVIKGSASWKQVNFHSSSSAKLHRYTFFAKSKVCKRQYTLFMSPTNTISKQGVPAVERYDEILVEVSSSFIENNVLVVK